MSDPVLEGVLLGTALGDALGLAAEGLSREKIARRWGRLTEFQLLGETGWVSDDTELAALTAQSLCRRRRDPEACALDFRRALAGWVLRLPWGVGLATLRSGLWSAATLGLLPSGVESAGNGAATRVPIVGALFRDDGPRRRAFVDALARVTHTDPRAVASARFAAELTARLAARPARPPAVLVRAAAGECGDSRFAAAVDRAAELAEKGVHEWDAAEAVGTSGYALHSVPYAAFCLARYAGEPRRALGVAASCGGDTDSIAALVGAWCGALHGPEGLMPELLARLQGGPFGARHLLELAACLSREGSAAPSYFWPAAAARNLAFYPVILGHGLRRLLP